MKQMLKAPFVRKVTKNLSDEDKALIEEAELPELTEITSEQLAKFRGNSAQNVKVMWQGIGLFAVVFIILLLCKKYVFCTAIGATMIIFAIAAFVLHLRTNIDQTSLVKIIPVHHTEPRGFGEKAIVYLPDGKYRLSIPRRLTFTPCSVTVVTCDKITMLQFNPKEIRKDDSQ